VKFHLAIPKLRRPAESSKGSSPTHARGRLAVLLGIAVGAPALIAAANFVPASPLNGFLDPVLGPVHDLLWHPAGSTANAPADDGGREARLARARARIAATSGTPAGGAAVTGGATDPVASGSDPTVLLVMPAVTVTPGPADSMMAAAGSADSAETPMAGAEALDRGPEVTYASGGRDPFRSLLLADPDYSLLDLEDARLVGVAWNHEQMMAMIEDKRGRAWSLRDGDHVQNGRLVRVTTSAAVFDTWLFGNSERKVLELIPKEEESQP